MNSSNSFKFVFAEQVNELSVCPDIVSSCSSEPFEDNVSVKSTDAIAAHGEAEGALLRYERNTKYFYAEVHGWDIKDYGLDKLVVVRPTASRTNHFHIHPSLYTNIRPLRTIDDVAMFLGFPCNWEEEYNIFYSSNMDGLNEYLNDLRNLDDNALENDVKISFTALVSRLSASQYCVNVTYREQESIMISGMLMNPNLYCRSQRDTAIFSIRDKIPVIATEIKRYKSYNGSDVWYRGSRGVQTLMALFSYVCPTFLLTQRIYKLFIENPERNLIYTFPYGDDSSKSNHENSCFMNPVGRDLIKLIYLLLSARKYKKVDVPDNREGILIGDFSNSRTPNKVMECKVPDSVIKGAGQRQSARLTMKNKLKNHCFLVDIPGCVPYYQEINVINGDVVEEHETSRFVTIFVISYLIFIYLLCSCYYLLFITYVFKTFLFNLT